tara:strand:+ start:2959 stop:3936 length:978 start_codon:yes stop_codon:yes gene_type:complete
MSSFENDLRLKEIATGAESGTWGTSTNTNLSLVAEAFSFGTEAITTDADTHTTTIADGATDPGRSLYLKYTGALDSDCTITLAPNTVSKVWFIENATTDSGSGGPYNIIISQGSGSNVTIPNGSVMAVYSDGGSSSANVVSVLTDVVLTDSVKITGTTPTLTIGDGGEEDTKVVFDGNAGDFHVGLDDSSDNLVLGAGTTLGAEPRVEIDKDGGVQIISDAPTNGQLKLSDIGANADQAILRHDSGVLSIISTQASDTVGSIQIQGQSTSGTFTYITFASSGTTTDKDIEITTSSASKSIILRSPDGSRFRITVDNSGNLSTASV